MTNEPEQKRPQHAELGESWASISASDIGGDDASVDQQVDRPALAPAAEPTSATASDGASETTSTSGRELLSLLSSASEPDDDDDDQLSDLSDWTAEDDPADSSDPHAGTQIDNDDASRLLPSTVQLDLGMPASSLIGPDSTSLAMPSSLSASSMPGSWSASTLAASRVEGARDIELVYPTIGPMAHAATSSSLSTSSSYFGTDSSGSTIMPSAAVAAASSVDRFKDVSTLSQLSSSISHVDIGRSVLTSSSPMPGAFASTGSSPLATHAYALQSFLADPSNASRTQRIPESSDICSRLVTDELGAFSRGRAASDDADVAVTGRAAVADDVSRDHPPVDFEWLKTVVELNAGAKEQSVGELKKSVEEPTQTPVAHGHQPKTWTVGRVKKV